jgi:hypothetical protein
MTPSTTNPHRTVTAAAPAAVAVAALAALALAALAITGHHILGADALKAAGGFKDVKPIQGVGNFVDALKGNLSWLVITALTLVVLVVGFLFMVGHSRAHDFAIRVIVGVAIVACAGGIVA